MNEKRKQRAFASLTDEEYQQVGQLLCSETYEAVLQRVNAPRPEGFGLNISIRPLQTLHEKMQRLQFLTRRIEAGEKLTVDQFDELTSSDSSTVPDVILQKVLENAHDLVDDTESTPTDLLALQKLADFPNRVTLREQRFQLDAVMRAHKLELDLHRKQLSEKRLALAERSLQLRERARNEESPAPPTGSDAPPPRKSDELGPFATNFEELRQRAIAMFGDHSRTSPVPSAAATARPSGLDAHYHEPPAAAPAISNPSII